MHCVGLLGKDRPGEKGKSSGELQRRLRSRTWWAMERARALRGSRGARPKSCRPNQDTLVYPTRCSLQYEGPGPTWVLVLHYVVRRGMTMVVSFPPPLLLQVHTSLPPTQGDEAEAADLDGGMCSCSPPRSGPGAERFSGGTDSQPSR